MALKTFCGYAAAIAARQHRLHRRGGLAHRVLHGQRARSCRARRGGVDRGARPDRQGRRVPRHAGRLAIAFDGADDRRPPSRRNSSGAATSSKLRWVLIAHIASGAIATAALAAPGLASRTRAARPARVDSALHINSPQRHCVVVPAAAAMWSAANPNPADRIVNPSSGSAFDARGGWRRSLAVLPVLCADQRRRHDPVGLLHGLRTVQRVSQRHLRPVAGIGAPLRVVQQPVLPEVDRVHAVGGRHHAEQVVRGLSRSRGVLQRPIRASDRRANRHARSPGRAGMHVVPRDRARRQLDGQRRVHDRVSAAASPGFEPAAGDPRRRSPAHLPRSRAASAHVHETVHAPRFGGVLRYLPQGPPRRAGQRLPLVPRFQRLRQLAGQRRVGAGGAIVLLPRQTVDVRGLSHAPRRLARRRPAQPMAWCTRTASRRRTPHCRSSITTPRR